MAWPNARRVVTSSRHKPSENGYTGSRVARRCCGEVARQRAEEEGSVARCGEGGITRRTSSRRVGEERKVIGITDTINGKRDGR